MSIRLDPRRVGVLKQLAAEADTRPGDLVRIWIEERLDAERRGGTSAAVGGDGGGDMAARLAALAERVSALEASSDASSGVTMAAPTTSPVSAAEAVGASTNGDKPKRRARTKVTAKPAGERVALHDEIIAVVTERGALPAAEIATAIAARGRYAPPRSGKPLDAATVNARVSNPTYRGRFKRSEGRIGLTEG